MSQLLLSLIEGSKLSGEDISIQEKQVDLISSIVILRACFLSPFLSLLQSMVGEGWLKNAA